MQKIRGIVLVCAHFSQGGMGVTTYKQQNLPKRLHDDSIHMGVQSRFWHTRARSLDFNPLTPKRYLNTFIVLKEQMLQAANTDLIILYYFLCKLSQ